MAARDLVPPAITVALLSILGACADTSGDSLSDSGSDETRATDGQQDEITEGRTTEPSDEPPATEGASSDGPGGPSECAEGPGDAFIDGVPGSAPNQGFLDLTRVDVDDRGTEIEVRWTVAAEVPARATFPDGSDGSNLWTINVVAPGDTLGYGLEVTQLGDAWSVTIVDLEESAETTQISEPADARIGAGDVITATFPTDSMARLAAGAGWFALTEGDGDADPSFDFVLPFVVQDRCPEAPNPLDATPTIPLR